MNEKAKRIWFILDIIVFISIVVFLFVNADKINVFAATERSFNYSNDNPTDYFVIANESETTIYYIDYRFYEGIKYMFYDTYNSTAYYIVPNSNSGWSSGNYLYLYSGSYKRYDNSSSANLSFSGSWSSSSGYVIGSQSQMIYENGVLVNGWHIYEPISYDGNLPMVELVYYGDITSRNNTIFIPRFELLTQPESDVINSDNTWNETYKVEYTMELYVASHAYANAVYQAYVDAGKDINNVRFQNALVEILRADMPLAEATQTVNATIEPYSSADFVTSPELLFYRPLSVYNLVSPINDTTATDRDRYSLAPYVFRLKSISSRIKSGNRFGKSTVNAYSVKQSYLTTYTYAEEINDDRNKAIEDSLSEAQDRYNELLYEYNRYVIDRQRLDAFSASESWYDIDIGKTAMQVIDIFDSMVDVVGSFADYTTMFMAWIPVSVLRLFIACLILNCIVSLYHSLRG